MPKKNIFKTYVQYPLIGAGVGAVWLVFKILPLKIASKLGGFMGGLAYYVTPSRNKVALKNMAIAFPEKSQLEHKELLKKMWRHWGRFFAEMPHSKEWVKGAEISGARLLEKMKNDGKGGFVCSAHLGNWEFASSYVFQHYFPLHPVYRPANNPWLDKLMFKRRAGVLIPKGSAGVRIMLDLLKKGEHISILCDQRLREGVEAPLFGRMAQTPAAMVTLAKKMDLPILMGKAIRMPDGHYRMDVEPLKMSDNPDFDTAVRETVARMNGILEKWIRQNPEQWLWVHRRFDKKEYKN